MTLKYILYSIDYILWPGAKMISNSGCIPGKYSFSTLAH